ncbi:MAG: PAS domain S-box protein [Magnetospirillum sp. WYHS-4]
MLSFAVLGASIVLQFAAAGLALALVPVTGRLLAWALIASAIILMAVRRTVTFYYAFTAAPPLPPLLSAELVALAISVLMVAGLALVRPLFVALRDSEARLRKLMDATPDAIFVCDDQGNLVDVNRRAVESIGHDRETLLSRNVFDIDAAFNRPAAAGLWAKVRGGATVTFESQHRRGDGSIFPVEINMTAIRSGDRELILGVARDISERQAAAEAERRAIEQLTRSHAELERFTFVATHDLQEPLRIITTYAQRLEREFGDRLDRAGCDYLDFVVGGARRMRDLVNALLMFSRANLKAAPFGPVDLEHVVATALETLGSSLDEAKARVCVGALPEVIGDGMQISLMIQHLLSNAVKYRRTGVPPIIVLSVVAHHDSAEWEIAVADNGIGIEPQYHEIIFQPFKRLHTQEAFPGTGVGLALCRSIAERHGGRIVVNSTPGEGSTFRAFLPAI